MYFGANYPESYEQILREVSKQADDYQNTDVIDVQATPTNVKKEEVKVEQPSSSAQNYIDQINALMMQFLMKKFQMAYLKHVHF